MKKIFALVLALAMVLSMVACGAKEPAATEPVATQPAATDAAIASAPSVTCNTFNESFCNHFCNTLGIPTSTPTYTKIPIAPSTK